MWKGKGKRGRTDGRAATRGFAEKRRKGIVNIITTSGRGKEGDANGKC